MLKAGLVELNWTFVFQICNTIILFLILKKFLFVPVTDMMESREKGISDSLQNADRLSTEADNYKKEYLFKLQSAEDEGREVISKATRIADEKYSKLIKEAREEVMKLKVRADSDIEFERIKAINEIKDEISSLAIFAASKVLESEVDEDKNRVLVNKFIEQVGDAKWQN